MDASIHKSWTAEYIWMKSIIHMKAINISARSLGHQKQQFPDCGKFFKLRENSEIWNFQIIAPAFKYATI